ncbi:MAG: alpha/beta hydrolase family esterase [Gammaproteobacteria bacterium]
MIQAIRRALTMLFLAITLPAFGNVVEVMSFGSNPGNLRMLKYVPPQASAGSPLIVVLHGCGQSAMGHATASGWLELAQRGPSVLLLPEQKRRNNFARCFNWFRPQHLEPGSGEMLSIQQMIEQMITDHAVDPARVFVTGVSAGGAMAGALLAGHPETFAGAGLIATVPYGCASGPVHAIACMRGRKRPRGQDWGASVKAVSEHRARRPIVSIWHGSDDRIVNPINAENLVQQWTGAHGIDSQADTETMVAGHRRRVYQDQNGEPRVEMYLVSGMGHGTPVDPGDEPEQCGQDSYFFPDANICASYYISAFWGLVR